VIDDTSTHTDESVDASQDHGSCGDAHNSEHGSDDNEEAVDCQGEVVDDVPESNDSGDNIEPPVPVRPRRERRPPDWMTRGDFVLSQTVQPEWERKADYLKSLLNSGLFDSEMKHKVTENLLSLINNYPFYLE